MRPVFVIGDVHGNLPRLTALLVKAECDSIDCLVVQLGDLGHFGADSRARDLETWAAAESGWIDLVLWGNHDRAVVDPGHTFGGYSTPFPETVEIMKMMRDAGRVKMALAAHGWLITHAGLHSAFGNPLTGKGAEEIEGWLNASDGSERPVPAVDGVDHLRGGLASEGGILWRDAREALWDGAPQIFGHTADRDHLVRGEEDRWWCVDIGGRPGPIDAECLAGIWLPSQEIVQVGPDEVLER